MQKFDACFLQSTETWDGDGDIAGYSGAESYSEGGLEEQGESEVQGVSIHNLCTVAYGMKVCGATCIYFECRGDEEGVSRRDFSINIF